MEIQKELRKFVEQLERGDQEIKKWISRSKILSSIQRLPGDASTRKYFRIRTIKNKTFIVMKTDSFSDKGKYYSFIAVQNHLKENGINVPEIYDFDAKKGFILLEDLGNTTLLKKLQNVKDIQAERKFYERVIDILVHLQLKASPGLKNKRVSKDFEPFSLKFDYEKLMWEIEFTIEHFYELHLKRKISLQDKKIILKGFGQICRFLADQPFVLAHRDFHSRNIMITSDNRIVLIDFQDARLGVPQYDLVSLLKDSYYQLDDSQVKYLIYYYISRYEKKSGEKINKEKFYEIFDLMSVQRNFKAIGSFSFFFNKRGDASYLKYIGNTFENIRKTLLKYPKFSALKEVLFHYYYF